MIASDFPTPRALPADIAAYNASFGGDDGEVCAALAAVISRELPVAEAKVWHAHPVWFLDGNPIVGYAVRKHDVQLLFWSGQSFEEAGLHPEGTFKAAQARLRTAADVDEAALTRWLAASRVVQWDYRNIRRTRGVLHPIPPFDGAS